MTEVETIRVATAKDAEEILAIYTPFCAADCHISFEIEPPSLDEMRGRIGNVIKTLPWLVAVDGDGKVLGYAYAGHHKERAAYRWSVDVSVYLGSAVRRKGLGRRLYERLFGILKELGYVNAYAGITLPNAASEGLHRSLGFEPVGVYKKVGYKAGQWHDVIWYACAIQPHADVPAEPTGFPDYLRKVVAAN